ncbi:hypothetical protein HKX48_005386 [Thoreauomyces humboldtii]|nr:hypothetical protein HKX48_005386 [Thoreauomyces humboldtii]
MLDYTIVAFHFYFAHDNDDTKCTADCLRHVQYPWDLHLRVPDDTVVPSATRSKAMIAERRAAAEKAAEAKLHEVIAAKVFSGKQYQNLAEDHKTFIRGIAAILRDDLPRKTIPYGESTKPQGPSVIPNKAGGRSLQLVDFYRNFTTHRRLLHVEQGIHGLYRRGDESRFSATRPTPFADWEVVVDNIPTDPLADSKPERLEGSGWHRVLAIRKRGQGRVDVWARYHVQVVGPLCENSPRYGEWHIRAPVSGQLIDLTLFSNVTHLIPCSFDQCPL